jgi:hypothetical protein
MYTQCKYLQNGSIFYCKTDIQFITDPAPIHLVNYRNQTTSAHLKSSACRKPGRLMDTNGKLVYLHHRKDDKNANLKCFTAAPGRNNAMFTIHQSPSLRLLLPVGFVQQRLFPMEAPAMKP